MIHRQTKTNDVHPLALHPLPEIAERRRQALEDGGWGTLEALASADPDAIARLPSMHLPLAKRTIARATSLLAELRPAAAEPEGPPGNPTALEKAGAKESREIPEAPAEVATVLLSPPRRVIRMSLQGVLDRIREARKHASQAKATKERREARASLGKLRDQLRELQSRLKRSPLEAQEWAHTSRVLTAVEHRLDRFIDRRPKRSRLAKVGRQARRAARSLRS